MLHLPDLTHPRHTLCGLPLTQAALGAYVEHLVDGADGDGQPGWVRTIFPLAGATGQPCPSCLDRREPVLAAAGP